MVAYLKDLPANEDASKESLAVNSAQSNVGDRTERVDRASQQPGRKLYEVHCADCHGEAGQGAQAEGIMAYPRLAGNRAVTMNSPLNLVRIVVQGGFPPATAGNPKPYGMPPFSHTLNDSQIAEVLSYIRQTWGNDAPAVYSLDVVRSR
jgi:mono/diheme cytochrome c family protein